MPLFFAMVAPLLFGALAAYLLVGRSGPVYERRYGILTFPDCVWTVPLLLTLASFWWWRWAIAPRFSALFGLALCSLSTCIMLAVAYWMFSRWTRHLPSHMKPLTYARLGASRYRKLVRTTLWQGLLAGVLDAAPARADWALAALGSLYLLAALPLLGTILVRARARARYGRTCYQNEHKPFDVFVSYRSQNVDAARRFADLALASHLKPWLAEYLIRFHSRDRFVEAIDRGTATSRAAVIFTGYGFFESPHCLGEIRQLVERNGSSGILEVYSPGEKTIADWCAQWEQDESFRKREDLRWVTGKHVANMRRVPSVSSLDHNDLLNAAREVLGLRIADRFVPVPESESATRFRGEHTGIPFSIDTAGWQEVPALGAGGLTNRGVKMSPGFKRDFGSGSVSWEVVLAPVVRRVSDPRYQETPPSDDDNRWLYNEYRDSAMIWLAENAAECHGVHLFWFAPGDRRPHLLVTHWGERMWQRRYAILREHDALEEPATFSFAFYFEGTFEDYCRHAPVMDAVVRSLRWES